MIAKVPHVFLCTSAISFIILCEVCKSLEESTVSDERNTTQTTISRQWSIPKVYCQEEKDLDVTFNEHLWFNTHNKQKHIKLIMCLEQSNELLILEMVMWQDWPFLDYSSTIWNPHQMGIIHELENVQRRTTKADILTYHNLFWKTTEPEFTQFILSSQSCAPDYDLQNFIKEE